MEGIVGGRKKKVWSVFKIALLAVLLAGYMIPFILVLINAFKRSGTIIRNPLRVMDPNGITLDNFKKAYESMDFPRAFFNSLLITVVSVAIIILISSMTAYLFVRASWKINGIFFALMVAAMIIPFQVLMIPIVSIYGGALGLLDHKATLIFFNVGFGISMATFIYHGFIKGNVPISLEEAAMLDGCTRRQTFFKIVFPILKPVTATIIVLDVLWVWNDYLLPSLVLTSKNNFTLPLSTYSFYGTYSVDYGALMAALVLTVIPVIILYLFLQRQIISGVISGAVKS